MPAALRPLIYTCCGLDRAAELRRDDAWLAGRRRDPASRVLLLDALKVPVNGDDAAPRLLWSRLDALATPLPDDALFLGLDGEAALFAWPGEAPALEGGRFVELRSVGALLPAPEAGIAAYARGLAFWHGRNRFCGSCGRPAAMVAGGHARRCEACGAEHFPRTDPAVIVLVHRGERCLLGRSARFVQGMYSTLAGFVEPGESLEEAVVREVREEAGIRVATPRYRASQPWPFPASLMVGFWAEARDERIRIDPEELVDARWFTRAELADPQRRPVRLPNPDSIARRLIEEWLAPT